MKNTIGKIAVAVTVLGTFAPMLVASAAVPVWGVSGSYVVAFNYQSNDYSHDMTLVQVGGAITGGNGGYPSGVAHSYQWTVDSGTVTGTAVSITSHYTATPDAVGTTMHMTGTIAPDGTMSGTWSDNYNGNANLREGTWKTTSGVAHITGTLPPADKDECKDTGWKEFTTQAFKNQGQCVSSVASKKK